MAIRCAITFVGLYFALGVKPWQSVAWLIYFFTFSSLVRIVVEAVVPHKRMESSML